MFSFLDYSLWRDYQGREKSHLSKNKFEDQKEQNWSERRAGNRIAIWELKVRCCNYLLIILFFPDHKSGHFWSWVCHLFLYDFSCMRINLVCCLLSSISESGLWNTILQTYAPTSAWGVCSDCMRQQYHCKFLQRKDVLEPLRDTGEGREGKKTCCWSTLWGAAGGQPHLKNCRRERQALSLATVHLQNLTKKHNF